MRVVIFRRLSLENYRKLTTTVVMRSRLRPTHLGGRLGGAPGNDGNDVVGADAGDLRGSNNGVEDLSWVFVIWAIPSRLSWGGA